MNRPISSILLSGGVAVWIALAYHPVAAQTNRVVITPPPPVLKSPMESFRKLLAMPTAERRQFLASRSTNVQGRLIQKLREYQSLTQEERDLRLTATELRWYLQPLMRTPATNRPAQLALIPENLRDLVASRVAQWDRIPAPVQQLFLTNEQAAGYLARVDVPTNFPPLPSTISTRQLMNERVNQLFELTPGEKEKVLTTLSDVERKQMEKTWANFHNLTRDQRRQCLLSFKQFTELSATERQEFLRNAERWSQMTSAQRQAWRELVSAAPNLPPVPFSKVATPALPTTPRKPMDSVTTNGGG